VVATLATSASWLATISVALAARQAGVVSPEVVVAGRALLRAAWLVIRGALPVALLAMFVAGLVALAWAQRQAQTEHKGVNHA
jgi:hypothetical protein